MTPTSRCPSILLFDIDGTLLPALGLGRRAMEHAFEDVCGRRGALDDVRFEGMTDRPIVRAGLAHLGVLPSSGTREVLVDQILARYLYHLERVVAAAAPLPVLPGVMTVLAAVAAWPATAVGLGTGNLRRGAEIKLTGAGLWHRFAFGGFACDHDERADLLRAAATRGAAILATPRERCRVVVIGDTPRDIAAAQAIGAVSIGVATSIHPSAALKACGATHAADDMTADGFLAALAGQP